MTTALVFLQNCYVYPHHREQWAKHMAGPNRHRFIAYGLFAGCKTGQVLRRAGFDPDWAVWENAGRGIGVVSSAVFPAEPEHMAQQVNDLQPKIVVLLGKIAQDGWDQLDVTGVEVLRGPHPTARYNTVPELAVIARRVHDRHREEQHGG